MLTPFVPNLIFGINIAYWNTPQDLKNVQSKLEAAGNYFIRYPGGSLSDVYHWNGTGSYDAHQYWVPSNTTYSPGAPANALHGGTTSIYWDGIISHLTDGDESTRWLSNVDTEFPNAQWAYLDLGSKKSIDSLQIVWGTPYSTAFQVQTWKAASAWPAPYEAAADSWQTTSVGVVPGTGGSQTVTFSAVQTQFVRVLMTSSSDGDGGAFSVAELRAYSGGTQVTTHESSINQTASVVSSTDPANELAPESNFDFESFMSYVNSFTPRATPLITVNVGTGTAQEAAAWVHYANIEKGYGIHYWQIGNETEGTWETGGPLNARDYARRYLAYYAAMKAEDPSIMVLGPVAARPDDSSNLLDGKTYIQDFIEILHAKGLDDHIDGIDFHWYPNWGTVTNAAALATVSQLGEFSANLRTWLSAASISADVPVFLTEYNISSGMPIYTVQLVNGLWVANALGEFIRYFGRGGGSNFYNAIDWSDSDVDPTVGDLAYLQGHDLQGIANLPMYQERACYWAMQMMSSDWAIGADSRDHQLVSSKSSQSALATYANLRPDGALALAVINRDEANAYATTIDVAPFAPAPVADVWTFDATNYAWETTTIPYHADPDEAPTHCIAQGAASSNSFSFSPSSITVIRFAPAGNSANPELDAGS